MVCYVVIVYNFISEVLFFLLQIVCFRFRSYFICIQIWLLNLAFFTALTY